MKGGIAAAAMAAMAVGASAHNHRRAHELFAKRGSEVCKPGCTTIYKTITGEATLVPDVPKSTTTSEAVLTTEVVTTTEAVTTEEALPTTTEEPSHPVPTPEEHYCPTTGTYTFPATTIVVEETTTVCAPATTKVPAGTHTVGGVTTVVVTATTVTCPIAVVETSGDVTTSVIRMTEYVCPEAGTYTIGPITTVVGDETVITYPVPTSYEPGTYTQPELVVTVTETGYVTYCPYTSSGYPAPTAEPEQPETPVQPPAYEEPEKPKPTKTPSKGDGNITDGKLGNSDNDHYGITYTPYEASNGACKSKDAVNKDIAGLKNDGFNIVRVYSTDCNTLEFVGDACKEHGMEMTVGVFVKGDCSAQSAEITKQLEDMNNFKHWDIVKLVVCGNESVMGGMCDAHGLGELIKHVKASIPYNGPVTIAETLNIWQQEDMIATICPLVDVVGANIHPYFNADVAPKDAGKFVKGQLDILGGLCDGKAAINLECGWPTEGVCNGKACPGQQQQHDALDSIRKECGSKTFFFSWENDMWKEAGAYGCEQSWGVRNYFSS